MREMIKSTLSLVIICVLVSFCLAFVNAATKDTIAQRGEEEEAEQRRLVLSEADSFRQLADWEDMDDSGLILKAFAAYRKETLAGYVFSSAPRGFGGEIVVTVGISTENKITGVKIGDNMETPGLGTKTADEGFTGQYRDRGIVEEFIIVKRPSANDREIQAVSGATVSSAAVTRAVQASADLGKKFLSQQVGGEEE